MTPFGGWDMPLSYPSGTLDEHRACRENAVVFDVSHLGTLRVQGAEAFEGLQRILTNDLGRIQPGRAQYTHLLDKHDASVLDDIIVWWVDDQRFDVMPNASNTSRVAEALGSSVSAVDVTNERAILAVQGPKARQLLGTVFGDAAVVGRFRVAHVQLGNAPCVVAGTGYTGEDGVEIAVPVSHAEAVWDAIVGAGITPAGLGARDTLRLEAGLPLHGQELGPGITPLQAGLGWVVRWDKGAFQGSEALRAERDRGVARKLHGISVEGRRPPRSGQAVLVDGQPGGVVTSGNFSPMLGHGIALAFIDTDVSDQPIEPGQRVQIEARGGLLDGIVVKPPFVTGP